MSLGMLLLVLLLIWVFVGFPRQGSYNAGWGYAPVSIGGVILLLIILWLFFGGGISTGHGIHIN